MKFTPLIASLLCAGTILAQDTRTAQYYAKAYANGSISAFNAPSIFFNTYLGNRQRLKPVNVLSPSFAFTIRNKRGNMHEIEWNKLSMNTTTTQVELRDPLTGIKSYVDAQKIHTTIIALRYEYIQAFGRKKHWIVQPSLGYAAMPYYYKFTSKPFFGSDYPTAQTHIGIRHFITPRINIALTKRVLLDVNIPICIMDAGTIKQKLKDPTLPARSQDYSIADLTFLPQYYTARIGLAVKL